MSSSVPHKNLLFMVLLGSLLETYDFSLYGYFAPILAQSFFPSPDPTSSLLASFTVFAVGFLTRPVGAAIFGYCGDKYGRKKILIISIMLMAIPTALIGMLPTYEQIGIWAGLLLALCRLLQGLAVGAEFVGTMVYMIEQAPTNQKTFFGSLCICSGYIAMLFTAIIVTLLSHFLSSESLQQWGWRIPFLFGLLLGILGLYIRSKLSETPAFKVLLENKSTVTNPLLQTITQMPFTLLLGIGVIMIHVLGFYLLFVYMTSYLNSYYKIPAETTSFINIITLTLAAALIPFIGMMAEKINKKIFILMSNIFIIILAYPLIRMLDNGTILTILIVQTTLTLFICITSAVLPIFLSELFPVSLRYTGMALCYNIAAVSFGGTAPLILTFLVEKTQNISSPAFYLMLAACVTLGSTILIKRNISA